MELLESIVITLSNGEMKSIELYHGDMVSPINAVKFDVLVTSAFPNCYAPLSGTLIGSLDKIGISLRNLITNNKYDLRQNFSCWMTEVPKSIQHKVCFSKILCYESAQKGAAWEFIGGVFQAIMPFIFDPPRIKTIAMPVLSSGNQGYDSIKMLDCILQVACNWLKKGMPIEKIMIVEINPTKAQILKDYFQLYKKNHNYTNTCQNITTTYDYFLSYSHSDQPNIDYFINILKKKSPQVKLFVDRFEINPGSSWPQKIYDALDNSNKVLTFLSPQYLKSNICKEEYNIARLRNLNSKKNILYPILLFSSDLPTYMQTIHYIDCTEADQYKLRRACDQISVPS